MPSGALRCMRPTLRSWSRPAATSATLRRSSHCSCRRRASGCVGAHHSTQGLANADSRRTAGSTARSGPTARSTSPAATPSTSASTLRSWMRTITLGLRAANSRTAAGSTKPASVKGAPMRTTPAARLRTSAAADSASCAVRSTARAEAMNSRPALESATRRVVRSNSRKPSPPSSSATSWLTADEVSPSRSPAAAKPSVSATAMQASYWRNVMRESGMAASRDGNAAVTGAGNPRQVEGAWPTGSNGPYPTRGDAPWKPATTSSASPLPPR